MTGPVLLNRFELRVRLEFNALPYRRWGFCGGCGEWRYVARRNGRSKWRCLACLDEHLAGGGR